MTRRGLRKDFGGALLVLLFAVLSAQAAEEGGGAANQGATELFKWINLALLIVAIWAAWLRWKVPQRLRDNAEAISSAITKATTAKAEADRELREAEGKLARLEQEVAQLQVTAQREAVAEAGRLRAITQSDIQKVGLAGKAEIEAAERAARLELKAIAANLAVDGAESQLVKQLTPQAQESLMAAFMKDLEGRPN